MQLQIGADVYTPAGDKVGSVDRVVVDPDSRKVTHFIVKRGFLFTEDKVVSMDLVDRLESQRVTLKMGEDHLDSLPEFEETHYVPLQPKHNVYGDRSVYWYPPYLAWGRTGGIGYAIPPYVTRTEKNIPKDLVVLEEGTRVFSSDGEQVGKIDQLHVDTELERVSHLIISRGLVFSEKKLIPTTWLNRVGDKEVHLSIDADFFEQLPDYEMVG